MQGERVRGRWDAALIGLGVLLLISAFFYVVLQHGYFSDEPLHFDEIKHFIAGDFGLNPGITQLPGYHALLAVFGALFRVDDDLFRIRLLSFCVSLLIIPVTYMIGRTLDPPSAVTRTLQVMAFPILVPFFFLVYTDALSLLLILLGFLLVWRRHPVFGGLAGGYAIFVRQDDALWVFLLFLLVLERQELLHVSFSVRDSTRRIGGGLHVSLEKHIRPWLSSTWIYVLVFVAFFLFVLINHGVSLGDKTAHPFPSFHLGNVDFALFTAFFLFLPLFLARLLPVARFLNRHRWTFALLALLFLFTLATFKNDHPYNQASHAFFLRNKILLWSQETYLHKIIFFLPIAGSVLFLLFTPLLSSSLWLLYPIAVLSLIPDWLIEQRYYLIPFVLFLLFRKHEHPVVEYGTVILSAVLSAIFLIAITHDVYFL
jgi:alpha-1,2-glucosyltransferase